MITLCGWLLRAGGSWRITSTRSVAMLPGLASAIFGVARRSWKSTGKWNSTSRTVPPPTSFATSAASFGPRPGRVEIGERRGSRISIVTC